MKSGFYRNVVGTTMRGRAGAPAESIGFEESPDAFFADELTKRIYLAG